MKDANPFPGLRPFSAAESHLFFGCETATDELLRKLRTNRFIAVIGTSGSGKSSLVQAGMLPDLYGGFMASAGSSWRVAVLRPGDAPIHALAAALAAPSVFGATDESADIRPAINETVLRRGTLGLVEVTRQARLPARENILVLVDQFEELFRFKQSAGGPRAADEAAAFVKLLLEAIRQDELPIYVVLTMRSEYLGDCTQFRDLPEAINAGQYLIPRMTRDQRRQAIMGPVAVGGASMTPRLVQRLLNDVGDNPDQLPILQHAMMRTWDYWADGHEENEPIDLPHYEATGGMAEALSRHADEAFNAIADMRHQKIAERLFKRLTGKGTDNREMRFPARLAKLCAVTGAKESQVVAIIDAFRQEGRSFLMPPQHVPLTGESLIDISHESLIRIWQRLRQWVDEEAQSARIYRRLAETSALYANGEAGLWRKPDLQIALGWRHLNHPTASWAQRYHPDFEDAMTFLNKSKSADRRRRLLITIPSVLLPLALIGFGIARYVGDIQNKLEDVKLAKQVLAQENKTLVKTTQDIETKKIDIENELEDEKLAKQVLVQENKTLVKTTQALVKTTQETVALVKTTQEAVATMDKLPVENQRKKDLKKLSAAVKKLDAVATDTMAELDALEVARAEKQKDDDKEIIVDSTTIASLDRFVTCGDVVKLEPKDCKDKFVPGKVYVFVRVRAPETQTWTLKWFDTNDKEFAERKLTVKKNLNGFRSYTWKNIRQPGDYNVRLYDPGQKQIRRHDFKIE